MNKSGPFLVIEDDIDDKDIYREVFEILGYPNPLIFLDNGTQALEYLQTTREDPFIIFCDINMPQVDGFKLKDCINNNVHLRKKSYPFIYFTTAMDTRCITAGFTKDIQGYFVKPDNVHDYVNLVKLVIEYWQSCEAPLLEPANNPPRI